MRMVVLHPTSLLRVVAIAIATIAIAQYCHPQCCEAFIVPVGGTTKSGRSAVAGPAAGPAASVHAIHSRQSISFIASSSSRRRTRTMSSRSLTSVRVPPLRVLEEPAEEVDTSIPLPPTDESTIVAQDEESTKSSGLSLVPLFFKFCVVLAVKFITDVLVFPPLFLWRFARLVYRKFMRIFFGKGSKGGSSAAS